MTADRPKPDNDDHLIDPAVKDMKRSKPSSTQPVNPAGTQRRENESSTTRDTDGQRKRAEEGL